MKDEILYEGVEAFAKNNMNLQKTAKELFVHRNTLIYRFGLLKKKTGLDPRKFSDLVELIGRRSYCPECGARMEVAV